MKTAVVYLKRILMCSLMFLVVNTVMAQDYQAKHEVRRGETLSSIAKQYGVTEQMIKNANPQMGDLFYVGLNLNIPKKSSENLKVEQEQKDKNELLAREYKSETTSLDSESRKGTFERKFYAGLSLNSWSGNDAKNSKNNVGFHVGLLQRYFLLEETFLEAGISFATKGYKADENLSSGQYWDDEGANYDIDYHYKMQTYNLEVPLNVGYSSVWSSVLSVYVKGGAYVTYALSGKLKVTGTETFYDDIHSSETGKINKETKIADIDGYKKFGYGVQAGVGFQYENYSFNFVYQRGLSKLMKDQKAYEQNLLFSIGYEF